MRVSVNDFRKDPMFRRIEGAVAELLAKGNVVAPVEVLVGMGLLRPEHLKSWRHGRVPYLERVINCNLVRLSRLLRILRFHAHDLNLKPSATVYNRYGKGPKQRLRFCKTGDARLEAAYATHFVWPGKRPFHGRRSDPASVTDASWALGRAPVPKNARKWPEHSLRVESEMGAEGRLLVKLHAKRVSVGESGQEYFQLLFYTGRPCDDFEMSGPHRPYLIVQRQFEEDEGGLCCIETHDHDAFTGHLRLRLAELTPTRLAFEIARAKDKYVEATYQLDEMQFNEVRRIVHIVFGVQDW
jgi:hypothetical protein